MEIIEVSHKSRELIHQLCEVWERSVRATHVFLSEPDIQRIANYVPQALLSVPYLIIAVDEEKTPVAFMGIQERKLAMLFIVPEECGRGLGRELLSYGIENYGVNELDVNEQNPQAKGFYEHVGFQVFKRTAQDEQGNPYPILSMKRI